MEYQVEISNNRHKGDPCVWVAHEQYNGEVPKTIEIQMVGMTVRIRADQEGFDRLKAVIEGHAGELAKAAENRLREAMADAEQYGVTPDQVETMPQDAAAV